MTTTAVCVHHYMLGDPVAGRIDGRCRNCGSERSWRTWVETPWDTSLTSPVVEARRAYRAREAERAKGNEEV